MPPEILANLESAYGLDQPILTQYGRYLCALAHGDFGPSFKYKDFSVTELIGQGFPVTFEIGADRHCCWRCCWAFRSAPSRRCTTTPPADYVTMSLAVVGIAIPTFVVLPFLGLLFGIYLHWLPVAGWEPGSIRHLLLPIGGPGAASLERDRAADAREHARVVAQPIHPHGHRQRAAAAHA